MRKTVLSIAVVSLVVVSLTGCAPETASINSPKVFVGDMHGPQVLDPAGTTDLADYDLLSQVLPSLLARDVSSDDLVYESAALAEFRSESEFVVTLKPNLKFSNGHDLTASDVVHSFNRIIEIADPSGPSEMLMAIKSVSSPSDLEVVFETTRPFDAAVPAILAGLPGLIVDEEVFPIDSLLDNGQVVGSGSWGGPYTLDSFNQGSSASLKPNTGYQGYFGVPENEGIELRYYSNADQLMSDQANLLIDVALVHRESFTTTTFEAAQAFAVELVEGPLVELGYLRLNANEGPFAPGAYAKPDAAELLRAVFSQYPDRSSIVSDVSGTLFEPADGLLPESFLDSTSDYVKPEAELTRVISALKREGIELPVTVQVGYPESLYGLSVPGYLAGLAQQLNDTSIFQVELIGLSNADFPSQREEQTFGALFDFEYPLYPDGEALLSPLLDLVKQLGIDPQVSSDLDVIFAELPSGNKRDRMDALLNAEDTLRSGNLLFPLIWTGRHALVRDGIKGSDMMLGTGGQLVLANLSRVIIG